MIWQLLVNLDPHSHAVLCEAFVNNGDCVVVNIGREVREQLFSQVTSLFHDLDMGMLPISVLLPYLPIPAHNRRDR